VQQPQSNKYAFNRRLKRDCPLNATKHLRKDKGELLYRLAAHGKKMHNKNSRPTRYVESSCTEIHLHAWKKIAMGLGGHVPPVPPPYGSPPVSEMCECWYFSIQWFPQILRLQEYSWRLCATAPSRILVRWQLHGRNFG